MKVIKIIMNSIAVLALILLILCVSGVFNKPSKIHHVSKDPNIIKMIKEKMVVSFKNNAPNYETIGTVSSQKNIVISSQTRGVVAAVYHKEGDFVKKDTILIRIADDEFKVKREQARKGLEIANASRQQAVQMLVASQANYSRTQYQYDSVRSAFLQAKHQYNSAEASFKQAHSQYQRIKKFKAQGAATQQQFEESESNYSQAKASLEQSKLGVQSAKAQLAGIQEVLKSAKAGVEQSKLSIDAAKSRMEQAQQYVKEADIALGYTIIKAPDNAVIIGKKIEPGNLAWPGKPLLILHKPKLLQLEAKVRESLRSKIITGRKYRIEIDSGRYSEFGTVTEIMPFADPMSRTFIVKLAIPYKKGIYPGMFGKLFIPLEEKKMILLPATAIKRIGQFNVVYVYKNKIWVRRYITLGEKYGKSVEILSGLNPGEKVAIFKENDNGGKN